MRKGLWLAAIALLTAACAREPPPIDLTQAGDHVLEASLGRASGARVLEQAGRPLVLRDVVRRALPASPPSRYRFALDVPTAGQLSLACGLQERLRDARPVSFEARVRAGSSEQTVFSRTLDPRSEADRSGWVSALVDLSAFAGRSVELVLETKGEGGSQRAFWGGPAVTSPRTKAPLMVLYLVDTLRADHTGPYGYARDTTPALRAFAQDAVVFESAISAASWTNPSVTSIFTSLLPGQHGVAQLRDRLGDDATTLAEMLQAKAFQTGAVISNPVVYLEGCNLDQGFDFFAGLHGGGGRTKLVPAATVVDAALGWIDARRGFPTFAYVHTMDPHLPYMAPPPFNKKFEPQPPPGRAAIDPRRDYLEPADRDRLIAQYDGEVAYGDQEFGRFVAGLKQRGLYDDAFVVFVADHGEEFLDHGRWQHGRSVFDELIHVPLIVKFPQQQHAARRVAQQVRSVDLLPTFLAVAGLPVPAPPAIVGRPLQGVLAGQEPEPPAIAEISHGGFVAHGVRTGRDKFVERFSPDQDELYFDLGADPGELRSILAERPERVRDLRAQLDATMTPNPYRHVVRVAGLDGLFDLELRTRGWILELDASGLGQGESAVPREGDRVLALRLRAGAGKPREVSFLVRPHGAPVWLSGTRDGRPLAPAAVVFPDERPTRLPVRLPEPESEDKTALRDEIFAPPAGDPPGVQVWLAPTPGASRIEMDSESCERMRALGYVASCSGTR